MSTSHQSGSSYVIILGWLGCWIVNPFTILRSSRWWLQQRLSMLPFHHCAAAVAVHCWWASRGGGEGRGGCVEPLAEHEIGLKSNNTLHFTDALYAEDSNLSLPHWHSSDGFLSPSPTLLRPFTLWITQTGCFRCTFELLSCPTWDQNVTAVSSSFASECRCLLSAAEACPHTVRALVCYDIFYNIVKTTKSNEQIMFRQPVAPRLRRSKMSKLLQVWWLVF